MLKVYSESSEAAKLVMHFVYYHGMAEEIQGHDLVTYVEEDNKQYRDVIHKDGIYPVMMIDNDGQEHTALLFRWTQHSITHGLVALLTDAAALEHCVTLYNGRAIMC